MASTTEPASAPQTSTVVRYRHLCSTCGRAFQRATGLERHRRSAHSKEKTYACEFCSQAYSRNDLLQRHVGLYHKRVAADKRMQEKVDLAMNQQPPPPLVSYDMDQGLLGPFNNPGLPEVLPNEPLMWDAARGKDVSTAFDFSYFSSSSLPWASSDFMAPPPVSFAGGDSGPDLTPGSFITSLDASPAIETLPTASFGDPSTDTGSIFLSPPQSTSVSSSIDLSSISDLDMWPLPQASHLDAYQRHFAHHVPFIHVHSLLLAKTDDEELEGDLRRAMTMVGGNYESLSTNFHQSGGDGLNSGSTMKPCDYYGCALLKAKTIRCIESMPEQPSIHVLLRRTQIMVLLQLVAMFSEVKTHRVSAKLSHGALLAIARELLQQLSGDYDSSWADWIQHEEIVRTLWSVYFVDSLQSFCYRRRPGLSLSELSHLPDLGPDELWQAVTKADFNERAAQSTTTTRESIFEYMISLKNEVPSAPLGCLSLAGQLLIVITLVTEIMSTVEADTATRRQFASRLRRIDSMPQANRGDALRTLSQALDRGDVHLRQQVDSDDRHLTRWLSLLHHASHCNMQTKGPTPFVRDFMPWYWAGMHLLNVLRGRLTPDGSDPVKLQNRLAPYSARTQSSLNGRNNDSIEVMHLMVRIRLSLSVLDGGAKMQSSIGSEHFTNALPALPDYLTTVSIAGLFPPFLRL